MQEATTDRRLTSFSHGAGCGCKLGPDDLLTVLGSVTMPAASADLLVAADTGDDAAVYRLPSGEGLIATLDSSPRSSTTRTTGVASPPRTRCRTSTRWAGARSSR